jgi:hypothetical protein
MPSIASLGIYSGKCLNRREIDASILGTRYLLQGGLKQLGQFVAYGADVDRRKGGRIVCDDF